MTSFRVLVVDAYDVVGRSGLSAVGATPAGQLYARELAALGCNAEVAECGSNGVQLPGGRGLMDFDGIVWSGSNLSVHKRNPVVDGQVALCRAAFEEGVPQFGSCWALQLGTVAAGGSCARNPRGREFGISRRIRPTSAGREHAMLRGRAESWAALTCHEDMVTTLPTGATLLAENEFCAVQALDIHHLNGRFWAVQYHPEYDFHETSCLAILRQEQLLAEGYFRTRSEAEHFVSDFEVLHTDPERSDLMIRYDVPAEVSKVTLRRLEIANWLATLGASSAIDG